MYEFIIAADNDRPAKKTGVRVGRKYGMEAALAIGACFAMPPEEGQDFNDLAVETGPEAVRTIIEEIHTILPPPILHLVETVRYDAELHGVAWLRHHIGGVIDHEQLAG